MTTATVVASWKDGGQAHLAVRVEEADGAVEYIGSVPLKELVGLTAAQQKAKLVAAAKAVRDAQVKTATEIGISGKVTL